MAEERDHNPNNDSDVEKGYQDHQKEHEEKEKERKRKEKDTGNYDIDKSGDTTYGPGKNQN